tara:strand:+ start:440 stop:826 length:387 start_codon:yes stop_codon:yes gene_type:complete
LKKGLNLAFRITEKEAVLLDLPGRISREYVSGKNGSKNVSLRLVEIQPMAEKAPRSMHFHPNTEECIYVLEGSGVTETPSGSYRLSVGDVFVVPPMEKHRTTNTGSSVLKLLCFFPTDEVKIENDIGV